MKAPTTALLALGVVSTASAAPAEELCKGVQQLRDLLLRGSEGGEGATTMALLDQCVTPLLLLPPKWASGSSAESAEWTAYCAQSACTQAVEQLRDVLPTCTWRAQLPSDAERELVVAQRVMTDCGGF